MNRVPCLSAPSSAPLCPIPSANEPTSATKVPACLPSTRLSPAKLSPTQPATSKCFQDTTTAQLLSCQYVPACLLQINAANVASSNLPFH